jgi:hypothetical protein
MNTVGWGARLGLEPGTGVEPYKDSNFVFTINSNAPIVRNTNSKVTWEYGNNSTPVKDSRGYSALCVNQDVGTHTSFIAYKIDHLTNNKSYFRIYW